MNKCFVVIYAKTECKAVADKCTGFPVLFQCVFKYTAKSIPVCGIIDRKIVMFMMSVPVRCQSPAKKVIVNHHTIIKMIAFFNVMFSES